MKTSSIFVILLFGISSTILTSCSSATIETREPRFVLRVIDGDTLELATGERVRLICVNTPEKNEAGYEEAKRFLANLTLNKTVLLEKDQRDRDTFKRLLRYVYVTESHNKSNESDELIFVNRELVQQGFAKVKRYKPDTTRCDEIAAPSATAAAAS